MHAGPRTAFHLACRVLQPASGETLPASAAVLGLLLRRLHELVAQHNASHHDQLQLSDLVTHPLGYPDVGATHYDGELLRAACLAYAFEPATQPLE